MLSFISDVIEHIFFTKPIIKPLRKIDKMDKKDILKLIFTNSLDKKLNEFTEYDQTRLLAFQEDTITNFNLAADEIFAYYEKEIKSKKYNEQYEACRQSPDKYREFVHKLRASPKEDLEVLKREMSVKLGFSLNWEEQYEKMKWMIGNVDIAEVPTIDERATQQIELMSIMS